MPKKSISKVKTCGVSAWDVHIQVKDSQVDFSDVSYGPKLSKWLGWMLHEGGSTNVPAGLTWVDSLKTLLPLFQKHNEAPKDSTVFDDVKMLHFLKFSLRKQTEDDGTVRHFFCFSTQFDNAHDEQDYINDMYERYGALMEVIWRHCEGFTTLLATPPQDKDVPDPLVYPHRPEIKLKTGYELSTAFLDLVDAGNVDRDAMLCLYNSNRDVSSELMKIHKRDSDKLVTVKAAAKTAHDDLAKGVPCSQVLHDLLKAI
jgi:hypothetical protein